MAKTFNRAEDAGSLARTIYDAASSCLMAHSIRAVEKHLRLQYRFNTQIVLQPCKDVLLDMGRLSWSSVAENSGDLTYIFYHEDGPGNHNHKRFCIAHELYHVVRAVASTADEVPRDQLAEELCDIFANELCAQHDKFYADQAKNGNAAIRFGGLPFRSV